MKSAVTLSLALLVASPAQAQLFRPSTVNGAVIGGIAGAVIGNNSGDLGHNAVRGAAIGTVAGALIGSAVDDSRERSDSGSYRSRGSGSSVYLSYGHSSYARHHHHHGYRGHVGHYGYGHWGHFPHYRSHGYYHYPRSHVGVTYVYRPSYRYADTVYSRPNYAGTGALFGGIAGAIIGHNSGSRNAWAGAAIGAGAGLLLGSVAEREARAEEALRDQRASAAAATAETSSAPAQSPQNVTIINNYYGNSGAMSSANSMFGR